MAVEPTGIPVLILKEGTQRTAGRDALRTNIMAARAVAEMVKTTFGPKGMDKMLVDALGDVTITNDGATILDKAEIQHPAAKMLVQVAKSQDSEVGDGTKRAVVFSGELLKNAEELLAKNIHPTLIIAGYRRAMEEALNLLYQLSEPISIDDEESLKKIAKTSLTSKAVHDAREYFAEMAVKAVKQIVELRGDKYYVDLDNIQIIKKYGGALLDSMLVYGIVLDKEVVHPGMPRRVSEAKIALLDAPLEIEKPEIDAEIRINDPSQLKAFLQQEEEILMKLVDKIVEIGANVVITQKGIDEVAQHFLAKKGILAVRRVKRSDLEKLERATGGRIVSNIDDLKPEDLGYAKLVEERKIGEDKMVFVEGCKNPRAVSIVIRGGLERLVDEAERSMRDALSAVADAIKDGRIVPGGGAIEIELAKHIRKLATKVGGKEQLAIEAFAKALEGLVVTLIENAGLDPVDMIMKLRAAHEKDDGKYIGVNVFTGDIDDMYKNGVIEPVSVVANAIKAGTEASTIILRIDDLIAASKLEKGAEAGKKPGEEEKKEED
ncbi:TCP-1/cpn60 chaperonin family protein [Thermosphaera chiliense]|uniref:TCP-1/cpn60 chaperonin family protein n=1 Tax=Thermosphaera chiliense TaxID=3402707 RepID=A0A7M1UQN2_9CREN|nr:thermosome subunit beta [Thermosphaera aggregans]QOR94555.1 TCP-1/cpn60 chaperonin family protein [Thermosphaera aggregans]